MAPAVEFFITGRDSRDKGSAMKDRYCIGRLIDDISSTKWPQNLKIRSDLRIDRIVIGEGAFKLLPAYRSPFCRDIEWRFYLTL